MWRCQTQNGERVNVFKHADPTRDTFSLFHVAGYSPEMSAMQLGDMLTWETNPILVTMVKTPDKSGKEWWNITAVDSRPTDAQPDPKFNPDPALARIYARDWAEHVSDPLLNYLILDTETTGTDLNTEIVSIAVTGPTGAVLLDMYIKPSNTERLATNGSGAINGITPDMLADAPTFAEAYDDIYDALSGEHIIIYNAAFDWALLERECLRHNKVMPYPASVTCAMEMFSRYYGEWNRSRQCWQPKSLESAAFYVGIEGDTAHNALGDCNTTLMLIEAMSGNRVSEWIA